MPVHHPDMRPGERRSAYDEAQSRAAHAYDTSPEGEADRQTRNASAALKLVSDAIEKLADGDFGEGYRIAPPALRQRWARAHDDAMTAAVRKGLL